MDILTANDRMGEYPPSYYAATSEPLAPFAAAAGALKCDVCVVGGGYAGLSAALHLAQAGYDVIVLEAQRLGFGASGRNGGQVGTGQRVGQDDLEAMVGQGRAQALWDLGQDAVQLVRDLIADHKMDCGFVDGIIHADHRARLVPHSHAYADMLRDTYGYDKITKLDRDDMRAHVGSPAYHGGTYYKGVGHTHPLRFA
jgi:gamma-glutamylputrescine oxidase